MGGPRRVGRWCAGGYGRRVLVPYAGTSGRDASRASPGVLFTAGSSILPIGTIISLAVALSLRKVPLFALTLTLVVAGVISSMSMYILSFLVVAVTLSPHSASSAPASSLKDVSFPVGYHGDGRVRYDGDEQVHVVPPRECDYYDQHGAYE